MSVIRSHCVPEVLQGRRDSRVVLAMWAWGRAAGKGAVLLCHGEWVDMWWMRVKGREGERQRTAAGAGEYKCGSGRAGSAAAKERTGALCAGGLAGVFPLSERVSCEKACQRVRVGRSLNWESRKRNRR